jgi:hypothetical protein
MKKTAFIFLILLMMTVSRGSAWAFGLSDHKRVMLQAISEFNACFNNDIDSLSTHVLWISDLDEDLNILRKDLFYSHYYNPEKPLKMFRYDSRVRVQVLMKEIQIDDGLYGRGNELSLTDLGHLIHHLQDMAAPPHVIPVSHGLTDGFEENTEVTGDISSGLSCAEIQNQTEGFLEIHQNTALTTLSRVRNSSFPMHIQSSSGQPPPANPNVYLSTTNFWFPSTDSTFGKYGIFGNVFGQTTFKINDRTYSVPANFYQDYKRQQLKLAVRSSIQGLALFYLK